jgi:hypothetical protein
MLLSGFMITSALATISYNFEVIGVPPQFASLSIPSIGLL